MTSLAPVNPFDSSMTTNPPTLDPKTARNPEEGRVRNASSSDGIAFDDNPLSATTPRVLSEATAAPDQGPPTNPLLGMITQILQMLMQLLGMSQQSPAKEADVERPQSESSAPKAPSDMAAPKAPSSSATPSSDTPPAAAASDKPAAPGKPTEAGSVTGAESAPGIDATSDIAAAASPEDIALADQLLIGSFTDVASNFDLLDLDSDGIVSTADLQSIIDGDGGEADDELKTIAREALGFGVADQTKPQLAFVLQSKGAEPELTESLYEDTVKDLSLIGDNFEILDVGGNGELSKEDLVIFKESNLELSKAINTLLSINSLAEPLAEEQFSGFATPLSQA